MTEIRIEKRKPVWPWILGLVLLALLAYFIGFYDKNDTGQETSQETRQTVDLIDIKENNVTVASFVKFMEEDTMKMNLDHTFTKEAFFKLMDATNAMAEEIGMDVGSNMDRVVKYVNRIVADPIEAAHADDLREAAGILTIDVLKNMQQAKYPGLINEVAQLEQAVAAINPEVLIVDQKEAVKVFFQKAKEMLD